MPPAPTSQTPPPGQLPDGRAKPRPGLEAQTRGILDAAVTLFSAHGSQTVSISQICQAAQISRPTFYRCFEDKDALLDEIYERAVFQPIRADLLPNLARRGHDPAWLRQTLDSVADGIFANHRYAALIFAESQLPHSRAHTTVNQAFDRACRVVQGWIQNSNGAELDDRVLKAVMAGCQWLIYDAIQRGASPRDRTQAKDAIWVLVSRLMGSVLEVGG